MRRLVFAFCLALAPGCGQGALAEPRGALEAERKAYEYARRASDVAAISLDTAAAALNAAVRFDADRLAAECRAQGKAGRELQECQHAGAAAALESGRPVADKIDAATRLQLAMRQALLDYERCEPGLVDRFCQMNAVAKAMAAAPPVVEAIEAARKGLRNVRPAH